MSAKAVCPACNGLMYPAPPGSQIIECLNCDYKRSAPLTPSEIANQLRTLRSLSDETDTLQRNMTSQLIESCGAAIIARHTTAGNLNIYALVEEVLIHAQT